VITKCASQNYGNQLLGWTSNSLLAGQSFIVIYSCLDSHLFHSHHSSVRIIKVFILVHFILYFDVICLESVNRLEYYEMFCIFRQLISTNILAPKYFQRY